MKIKTIELGRLPHEAYYAFQTAVKTKVEKFSAATLGIEAIFALFLAQLNRVNQALELIRKSGLTSSIEEADRLRDLLFRGLSLTIEGACMHYDEAKKQAAMALQLVMDHYGNLAQEMKDAETGSIMNLAAELRTSHASELASLALTGWLDALEAANENFVDLRESRDTETGGKTKLRMAQERPELDSIYRSMTELVNIQMRFNGTASAEAFVNELNAQIDHYRQIIALRKGLDSEEGNTGEGEVNEGGEGEITPQPLP